MTQPCTLFRGAREASGLEAAADEIFCLFLWTWDLDFLLPLALSLAEWKNTLSAVSNFFCRLANKFRCEKRQRSKQKNFQFSFESVRASTDVERLAKRLTQTICSKFFSFNCLHNSCLRKNWNCFCAKLIWCRAECQMKSKVDLWSAFGSGPTTQGHEYSRHDRGSLLKGIKWNRPSDDGIN